MADYDEAFQSEIVRELGCKPCGEVAAIRALKDRVREFEARFMRQPMSKALRDGAEMLMWDGTQYRVTRWQGAGWWTGLFYIDAPPGWWALPDQCGE